jgi:hypothetical protein
MHYSTASRPNANSYVNNAKGFQGDGVISIFNVSSPFGLQMKAIFRFIILHCGRATVFEEFEGANGKVQGIEPLIRGLKAIAKNILAPEKLEAEEQPEVGGGDGARLAKEGGGKKRALEDGDEGSGNKKRSRTGY